jgi:hypothetical protein
MAQHTPAIDALFSLMSRVVKPKGASKDGLQAHFEEGSSQRIWSNPRQLKTSSPSVL